MVVKLTRVNARDKTQLLTEGGERAAEGGSTLRCLTASLAHWVDSDNLHQDIKYRTAEVWGVKC